MMATMIFMGTPLKMNTVYHQQQVNMIITLGGKIVGVEAWSIFVSLSFNIKANFGLCFQTIRSNLSTICAQPQIPNNVKRSNKHYVHFFKMMPRLEGALFADLS